MPPPPPRRCLPAGNVRPEQTGSGGVPTPYPLATQQWAAPVGRTSRSSPLPVVLRRSGVHVFAQPGRYAERFGTMRRGPLPVSSDTDGAKIRVKNTTFLRS